MGRTFCEVQVLELHITILLMTVDMYLDSDHIGPPQNIRAWMKFIAAGCQVRCVKFIDADINIL